MNVTTEQAVDFAAKAAQREHQFKTAFRSIELFNKLIGTETNYKAVFNQLERVQEELTETFEAIANDVNTLLPEDRHEGQKWHLLPYHTFEQKVELLDGVCDQLVVVIGLIAKLEALGYDVFGALNEVCENNTSKFTKELIVAQYTQRHYEEELDTPCTIVYNEEHKLYGVRRDGDMKLMKPINYKPVNIEKYVPKEN